ncbi:MAG TPA: hypothetical protein VGG15_08150 [Terriglobales bacterium]|jgi:hypothetical protein
MVLLDRFSLLALHFSPERTSQYFSTIAGFEIGKSSSLDAKQTLPDSSATRHAIGAKTTPRKEQAEYQKSCPLTANRPPLKVNRLFLILESILVVLDVHFLQISDFFQQLNNLIVRHAVLQVLRSLCSGEERTAK